MKTVEKKRSAYQRGMLRLFGVKPESTAPAGPARVEEPAPVPRSRVNDGDAYAALAPERLDAEWERAVVQPRRGRMTVHPVPALTARANAPVKRFSYERELPTWAAQALESMDRVVARPIAEMRRFVARCQGLPVERHDWETPQYQRRHADAMADTGEVLRRVASGDVHNAKELILAGARRASSAEVTGLIPTVVSETDPDPLG